MSGNGLQYRALFSGELAAVESLLLEAHRLQANVSPLIQEALRSPGDERWKAAQAGAGDPFGYLYGSPLPETSTPWRLVEMSNGDAHPDDLSITPRCGAAGGRSNPLDDGRDGARRRPGLLVGGQPRSQGEDTAPDAAGFAEDTGRHLATGEFGPGFPPGGGTGGPTLGRFTGEGVFSAKNGPRVLSELGGIGNSGPRGLPGGRPRRGKVAGAWGPSGGVAGAGLPPILAAEPCSETSLGGGKGEPFWGKPPVGGGHVGERGWV